MNEKTLKTLEYDKILELLRQKCGCCVSRELAGSLRPFDELDDVNAELGLTSEAESYYLRTGSSPVDDFPDMRSALKRVNAVLHLSCEELLNVMKCLKAIRICQEQLTRNQPARPADPASPLDNSLERLQSMASGLMVHRAIEEEIDRCILSEDEVFDGASPALSRIRRQMKLANEKVRQKLNDMIRSSTYSKYLQDPLVTIRNGRFVIPVKQEYRQNIPGLIHDQSGTGATLFIEPSAVVELGNEYKKLVMEEAAEVERILTELTEMIKPSANDIFQDLMTLGEIDLCFAKAKLAREMKAVCPKLDREGRINIKKGRHPLIDREKVVPIDVWLGGDFTTLIVTGPNTGGKTVTLKTIGLFTLMAQSGMFVPANVGTELAVFEKVFADIGDEQSIEQSLSTFSSHMRNIVGILDEADDTSLILLDELGAGTDPVEGAALAQSILEELHSRGCRTAATTHYSEIKAFALMHEGMQNASMEFDVDRLCPTYRLFIGIPGKSNAFEISKRLGMSDYIIENAREYLSKQDVDFESVLSKAESEKSKAEREREEAESARRELDALRADMRAERRRFETEKAEMRMKAKEEARKIVADAKREMEAQIQLIRALKDVDQRAADRVIQQARDSVREKDKELYETAAEQRLAEGPIPKFVTPGQTVHIASLDKNGTVIGKAKNGEVPVQVGIIKLNVKLSDLREVQEVKAASAGSKVEYSAANTVGLELDIRGMMVDDAKPVVDRYLDDCKRQSLSEVSIIHGKGTGALRTGIQAYLKHHPRVKSFRNGNYGEGDFGV
ncbi:MAG: endonuclease MutS2, partial [Clostridia bacterium]|nr:endonuclease MutS2 [Clostridia bacterium]